MKKEVVMDLGSESIKLHLPSGTRILSMSRPEPLPFPEEAIRKALLDSIASPGLDKVVKAKLKSNPEGSAVIVISDNTRPVPYKGPNGILWPVIKILLDNGMPKERIRILVANGTHRRLDEGDLREMLDPRIFENGISILNHDCRCGEELLHLGKTCRGSQVYINKNYVNADIKILTGLVESHFMAGASGGRKSVCPGIAGEESTHIFHSASFLASPEARDLQLEGNPCHEEALEVAKMAGVDYIINVTLDHHFNLTGVFAGDLEQAHQKAVERIKEYITIPIDEEYDIIITHAGFVGINHYQAAKAAVVAIPALKPGGRLIMAANNTDLDPIGSPVYRTLLHLLKQVGSEKMKRLLLSPDWPFIPEQWQVQMWTRVFDRTPPENFIYYSPQMTKRDYEVIPCQDGNLFLPPERRYCGTFEDIPKFIESMVDRYADELRQKGQEEVKIACLADGPYGIPYSVRDRRS